MGNILSRSSSSSSVLALKPPMFAFFFSCCCCYCSSHPHPSLPQLNEEFGIMEACCCCCCYGFLGRWLFTSPRSCFKTLDDSSIEGFEQFPVFSIQSDMLVSITSALTFCYWLNWYYTNYRTIAKSIATNYLSLSSKWLFNFESILFRFTHGGVVVSDFRQSIERRRNSRGGLSLGKSSFSSSSSPFPCLSNPTFLSAIELGYRCSFIVVVVVVVVVFGFTPKRTELSRPMSGNDWQLEERPWERVGKCRNAKFPTKHFL